MSKKDKARTMTLDIGAIPDVLRVLHLGIENLGKSESMTFEQGKATLASYREACSVKLGNLTKVFPNVLAVIAWDRDGVDITMPSMAFIDKVEGDAGRMD